MEERLLPLVILAGSDRSAHDLPVGADGLHPLSGLKGYDLQRFGKPLIDSVVDLFLSSGAFGPCYIAGPAAIYGSARNQATIIDTDGSFGDNLKASLEAMMRLHPGTPVAVTTCDVLPDQGELLAVLEDYRRNAPLDFWFPLFQAPEDITELGISAWKPRYKIPPRQGEPPREILPGHLLVIDLSALRVKLIYSACDGAYESRNQSILYRLIYISSRILASLIRHDIARLFKMRAPTVTCQVLWNGLTVALKLRRGALSEIELARCLRNSFTTSEHRRLHPDRIGRIPALEGLSLAKDIDTVEEANELLASSCEKAEVRAP